ncbi:hypothetical protein MPSEU_000725200 [Mayamaea pseudoterrestris]|nr:hypothetical protein MPSEU_000725200 [Mayamaea pseudoterrestris]
MYYLRHDELEKQSLNNPLRKDELVWVLQSKGRRRKAKNESGGEMKRTSVSDNNDVMRNNPLEELQEEVDQKEHVSAQRLELFLRARITDDDALAASNSRIRVQYPLGSTYTICRSNIVRILDENQRQLVLVYPETPIYRRACVVNTLPDDVFVEIGSAFGDNVNRVYQKSTKRVFGVDKSETSVATARKNHPHLNLLLWDILEDSTKLPEKLAGVAVDVLAIDINGTRELEAVLQCLQVVFDLWEPRLVIVKSRNLHQRLSAASG